ncbi:MAG: hypothetical protein ACQKBT_08010 [Puniceicoccales bacterium]
MSFLPPNVVRFCAFSLALLGCAIHSAGYGEVRHEGVHVLANEILTVEVMDPDAEGVYYQGIRFASVANILRVVRDGHDFLYSPVDHNPFKHNAGLAMEFDMAYREGAYGPPGYDDAAVGEAFLKIGVGSLRRASEDPYRFFNKYEVVEKADTQATWSPSAVQFRQVSPLVNGYAYSLTSDITLVANRIVVSHRLSNMGTRPFTTRNYAHNFIQFDDITSQVGYQVRFPFDAVARIPKPAIIQSGRQLNVVSEITPKMKAADAFFEMIPEPVEGPLELTHEESHLAMEIRTSPAPSAFILHVSPRYICPEQFLFFDLNPGQSVNWSRTYTFSVEL